MSAEVINIHTTKPLDSESILKSVEKTGAIVTTEEHNFIGGLGESIAGVLTINKLIPQEFVAVDDSFGEFGKPHLLLKKYGLDYKPIIRTAQKVINRKKNIKE